MITRKRIKVFVLSPLALENGRGGEISSMELASGLKKYYNVTFMDTNIFIGKSLLSSQNINKKLKGLKKSGRITFATLNLFNKFFDFPYPREILRLYKIIKKNNIIYTSFHNIKFSLILIFFSLVHHRAKYIIGYRKPLYSKKLFSLYNLKYRVSILLLSLFKKKFYHHVLSHHAQTLYGSPYFFFSLTKI